MATFCATKRASALLLARTRSILQKRNAATTGGQLVEVSRNDNNGITTLSLARAPVNSMNLEFLVEMRRALEDSEKSKSAGVIITSSLPKVFSAGLDIREFMKPDLQRCNEFWSAFQDLWLTLYGLKIPVAAAINGSSPAGGCMMAMSCEYRAMVRGEYIIGINEAVLGILVPEFVKDTMIATIGYRRAEQALMMGTFFKPDEALSIGLIDELADDKNDALAKCEKYILEYSKIPSGARAATKLSLRGKALDWLKKNRELDRKTFVDYLLLPKVQEGIHEYMQSIKRKAK